MQMQFWPFWFRIVSIDREHAVDGQDTGLQGLGDALSVNDTRCRLLDRAVLAALEGGAAVDRRTQGVDNAADVLLGADDAGTLAGSRHTGALSDRTLLIKEDGADVVAADVLHHALDAVLKEDNLAVLGMLEAFDRHDAVAGRLHEADLVLLCDDLEVIHRRAQDRHDVLAASLRRGLLPCGIDAVLKLPLSAAGAPVVLVGADIQNEAAVDGGLDADLDEDISNLVFLL